MIALQLVGSPTSLFFYNLSLLYAKQVVQPEGFELLFVVAHPDGQWSVSPSLEEPLEKISLAAMLPEVEGAVVAIPHLFCEKGLTSIRLLFEEVLGIPLVGSSGHTAFVAQDKQLTKLQAIEAGVRVPQGQLLKSGADSSALKTAFHLPVIIKPNTSDNSDGLSWVQTAEQWEQGFDKAFQFGDSILIEEYIPGRELRGAVLEQQGEFTVLPFIEYEVHEHRPIRQAEDKLTVSRAGEEVVKSTTSSIASHCPAVLEEALQEEMAAMMIAMHQALGCREFSLYDFRIHQETQQPYLLEAGLFWSFSKESIISSMLKVQGEDLEEWTRKLWLQAMERKKELAVEVG